MRSNQKLNTQVYVDRLYTTTVGYATCASVRTGARGCGGVCARTDLDYNKAARERHDASNSIHRPATIQGRGVSLYYWFSHSISRWMCIHATYTHTSVLYTPHFTTMYTYIYIHTHTHIYIYIYIYIYTFYYIIFHACYTYCNSYYTCWHICKYI